ncbi:hypothetical protein SBP02_01830 [Pseudomonas benzenivorans]|uniref:Uncharacterized protein n=1 Tax=Pseudomonas benzenivorans TaxID=556533 RepID=A0ABZ0PWE8_9PSED|nr:hypothetical protein [Pseudomonas benzenivorans]WPC05520.1 hypothetical protein SBP02_01830 [Pseudomonas benzenivorans]
MKAARAEVAEKTGARIIAEIAQTLIKKPLRVSLRTILVPSQNRQHQNGAKIPSSLPRSPRQH